MKLLNVLCFTLLVELSSGFSQDTGTVASRRSPNPVVKTLAQGMSLLKPAFVAEAKLQADILGANVDTSAVAQEIANEIQSNDIVIYTYALSPFSTEAIEMLKATGYDYSVNELGAEWFLLGPEASTKRVVLSEYVENGATSLPKVFVKGDCIGGCAELAAAIETGSLESRMAASKSVKKPALFDFFSPKK